MLDVGIGTGAALVRCADLVRVKRLQVVGLDIDRDYLRRCRAALTRAGLSTQVRPVLSSVYDHRGGPYDAVYFSASLMLLPDPAAAIAHVAGLLAPDGRLFATQTFQHRRSPLLERVKPMFRHVTTIHFGRVTYEEDFRLAFADAGVDLVELVTMRGHPALLPPAGRGSAAGRRGTHRGLSADVTAQRCGRQQVTALAVAGTSSCGPAGDDTSRLRAPVGRRAQADAAEPGHGGAHVRRCRRWLAQTVWCRNRRCYVCAVA